MYEDIEKISYPMKKESRGIGLIIVNHFKQTRNFRKGAQIEEENLSELFTTMGLEVRLVSELTSEAMIKLLKDTASDKRLKNDSMIAVAISSHGTEEGLLGIDIDGGLEADQLVKQKQYVSPDQIRQIFNVKNCPKLRGKPKIFFFNGCRGEGRENIECDCPEQLYTTWSDLFTIYSSQLGYVSLRSTTKGSLFICEFLRAYKAFGRTIPLDLMMVIVNRNIIFVTSSAQVDSPQSCTWESSCTRAVYIPPFDSSITPVTPQPPSDASFKLVWATCTKGIQGPNQMSTPGGVLTTPWPNEQIYITDSASKCIWVYSSDGEPMYQNIKPKGYIHLSIGNQTLTNCWGMCIRKNFLFVSCDIALIKLPLNGGGVKAHRFHNTAISGIDADDESTIYACERHSCNILLLDLDLKILPEKLDLTHTLSATTDRLMDIKVLDDELYILVSKNEHTIQKFDKKGNHLRNLVLREDLKECLFFTINRTKTIFAGDTITNELKAFNANGTLIYRTGCHGDERGNLIEPAGIDLNDDGEVIIVSSNKTKFMLQCFQVPANTMDFI